MVCKDSCGIQMYTIKCVMYDLIMHVCSNVVRCPLLVHYFQMCQHDLSVKVADFLSAVDSIGHGFCSRHEGLRALRKA